MTLIIPSRALSIFVGAPGAFRGALVGRTTDFEVLSGVTTPVEWEFAEEDSGGWFGASGDSVLTVPSGVRRARLSAGLTWSSGAGAARFMTFEKNGVQTLGLPKNTWVSFGLQQPLVSGVIEVVAGDTLRLRAWHDAGVPIDVTSALTTYFGVEAVR